MAGSVQNGEVFFLGLKVGAAHLHRFTLVALWNTGGGGGGVSKWFSSRLSYARRQVELSNSLSGFVTDKLI